MSASRLSEVARIALRSFSAQGLQEIAREEARLADLDRSRDETHRRVPRAIRKQEDREPGYSPMMRESKHKTRLEGLRKTHNYRSPDFLQPIEVRFDIEGGCPHHQRFR